VKPKFLLPLIGIAIISMSITPAFADSISYTNDIRCIPPVGDELQTGCDAGVINPSDIAGNILAVLGMDPTDETLTDQFLTPPHPNPLAPLGTPPDTLTYTFLRDTGIFQFSFGFCPISAVTADGATNPQLFAEQCLGAATEIFDDTGSVPGTDANDVPPFTVSQLFSGDKKTFIKPTPGIPVYFYLLPDNNLSFFIANSGQFYPAQTNINSLRAPLFSFVPANPGTCVDINNQPTTGCDQMLGFTGQCPNVAPTQPSPPNPDPAECTVFMFEDLSRDGISDEDFTDIVFIVDAVFKSIDRCLLPNPPQECLGGEFLPIESSALLLAGLQTSAVWILPIVIAGAGAGIAAFQLRRK